MVLLEPSTGSAWRAAGPVFGDCSWTPASPDEGIVEMRGEIDAVAVPSLYRCIDEVIAAGYRLVVLHMADVEFIDSVGLSAIVRATKLMDAHGGCLTIRRPSARVRRVLDMVGMTAFVPVDT